MRNKAIYYQKQAQSLGWGEQSAKLDEERQLLLSEHLVGKKVLDVGCGIGIYVDYINSLGFDGWGLDLVGEFVEKANKTKRGSFIKGEAENLPFEDDQFDSVVLFDVLEHTDDHTVLREAKRVAAKRLLVIVPRRVDGSLERTGVVFRHYIDKSHLREYEREDLENLGKKVGLKTALIEPIHCLNIKQIFASLFDGSIFLETVIFRLASLLMKKISYPTQYFTVFEK